MILSSSISPQFHHRHHDVRSQIIYRSSATATIAAAAVHCCNPNSAAALRQVNSNSSSSNDNNNGNGSSTTREEDDVAMTSSASAVAAAIRKASTSPVEFVERIEKDGKSKGIVLPSSDFQTLCVEQLDLFRRIVHPEALLSTSRQLCYGQARAAVESLFILEGMWPISIATGLRAAEASLLKQQAEFIPESRALVFPYGEASVCCGVLVAEIPKLEIRKEENDVKTRVVTEDSYAVYPYAIPKSWEIQSFVDKTLEMHNFSAEQRLNAINISRSVAMAYVMDQKAMLLQQSSWQNNIRMSNLVEQIRGPLASIRTLSKMLSANMKKNETSYDIVEDIMVLGDGMKETLQQLQDAVHMTKANIVRYNEENLMKVDESNHESVRSQLSNFYRQGTEYGGPFSLSSKSKDLEMPMPPLTQMHSLTPFGTDLLSKGGMVEDNMTWNFIAGLTVAREILETYGCVLRVISPRFIEAALGAGGTRVEIWLPSFTSSTNDGQGVQSYA
ncbi:hypothetical protein OSB04_008956 [Centaurea solstitialis]|uniref:Chloroplast sensor kinase, chloroplastic n=1 Tax=Centaurea solstitialis TaxID=347529 RepID=A0AA38WU57_9ASTR|nr:hypothetical protein OSB04_008956 [Centaurea solstitialis]